MAVNTNNKALNICTEIMAAAEALMGAVEALSALKDEKESSGLNLQAAEFQTILENSPLAHASGLDFDNVLTSGAAIKTFMVSNFHDDILQKVRP